MAIANFVPEVWSARLLRHLDSRLVYAQPTCVNRDYEGEISQAGDTVHIQKVGAVTAKAYTKNTDMDAPERPDGTTVPLTIDEEWYWNIAIDDVDKVQVNVPLLDRFAERAGRAMAVQVDSAVAAVMVAGAGIDIGTSAAPKTVGNGLSDDYTLYELAVEQRRLLDNNVAPEDGRWFVIPPDLESSALLDPNFVPAGANEQRTGIIGRMAGFDILKTTAVPTIEKTGAAPYDSWGILFGAGNYATTHANQILHTEAYRIEKQFGDALKGLNVWGTDVIEAASLGCSVISKGA
jgi:N4-gp56 family major capsid protein